MAVNVPLQEIRFDERGLVHRVLVPPGRRGRLRAIRAGAWRVDDAAASALGLRLWGLLQLRPLDPVG